MPPLPDTVSILLRTSPTAAMAALLLISTSHRGLLDWFSRTVCAEPGPKSEPAPAPPRRKARASARCGNGHRQPRANGDDPYLSRRLAKREADDKALLDAMRRNTEASISELATAVGKSRTSIVSALHRLRDAGLAELVEGKWKLTEEPAPRELPARWIEPLRATSRREHAGTLVSATFQPTAEAPQSVVDAFWPQLRASTSGQVEERLAAFVRERSVARWAIATDFCIREKTRPVDSFSFVVIPLGERMKETRRLLDELPQDDLKDAKSISPILIKVLREGSVFTLSFAVDRSRRIFEDIDALRRSIDQSIDVMRKGQNADLRQDLIKQMIAVRAKAARRNFSVRDFEDIVITSALISYITVLLARHSDQTRLLWIPDRDKIVSSNVGVVHSLFVITTEAACRREGMKEPFLGVATQTNENLWCDPFTRLADYVAGATAAWDPPDTDTEDVSPKISEMITKVFVDNPYLFLFRVASFSVGGLSNLQISRVTVARAPATGSAPRSFASLAGQSTKLIGSKASQR